jgi:6-phosphogluconolactonase (cycloisomerase 2 family)
MQAGEQKLSLLKKLCGVAGATSLLLVTGCAGFFQSQYSSSSSSGSGNGDYVYVANAGSNTLNAYEISSAALTAVSGSPYTLTYTPTSVAVTIPNTYVYVGTTAGVYGYSIGTGGVLTQLSSGQALQSCGGSGGVSSLDVSPDGQWLIELANDGQTLCVGQINTTTGLLTAGTPVTYAITGAVPKQVRVAPNGAFIFAALGSGGTLVFPFTTSSGSVSTSGQILTYATTNSDSDNALAIDPNTAFVYIARSGATNPGLWVYSINSTNGALSSQTQTVGGVPYGVATNPHAVSFSKTGTYVYSGDYTDGQLDGFTDSVGQLTATPGTPYNTGNEPVALAYDNSSSYIVAVCQGGSPAVEILGFDANYPGRLYAVSSSAAGTTPTALAVTH